MRHTKNVVQVNQGLAARTWLAENNPDGYASSAHTMMHADSGSYMGGAEDLLCSRGKRRGGAARGGFCWRQHERFTGQKRHPGAAVEHV